MGSIINVESAYVLPGAASEAVELLGEAGQPPEFPLPADGCFGAALLGGLPFGEHVMFEIDEVFRFFEVFRALNAWHGVNAVGERRFVDDIPKVVAGKFYSVGFKAGTAEDGFSVAIAQAVEILGHDGEIGVFDVFIALTVAQQASHELDDGAVGGWLDDRPVKIVIAANFFDRRSDDDEQDVLGRAFVDVRSEDGVFYADGGRVFAVPLEYAV